MEHGGIALGEAVRQPGAIWCYSRTPGGEVRIGASEPPADHPFRWLHLNLSDQRSLRWVQDRAGLPHALRTLLLDRDDHQHFKADRDGVALVIHDFERGLDPESIGRIASLRIVLVPGLIITGRARPLHGADMVRARLEKGGAITDAPAALALLLNTHVDSLAALALDLATHLLDAEEELLTSARTPDTRMLISARQRSAQLHRMIGGLRAIFQRMEREPGVPADLAAIPIELLPRLAGLDGDIVAAQQQLRLLRDELDLQATQRTNQNVYLLSIRTALMMPATLVTGFFGMNTGGLPFAGKPGTFIAAVMALLSSAFTFWLLGRMGMIRRD